MPMPMQVSLEDVISMLLARVESQAVSDENNKTRFNVITRVLYKKGLLTEADVLASVKEEHKMLAELGVIPEMPTEEIVQAIADSLLQWIKGDVEGIKQGMKDYEEKVREYNQKQEKQKPSIAVASSDVLHQLDKIGGKSGSKLIL